MIYQYLTFMCLEAECALTGKWLFICGTVFWHCPTTLLGQRAPFPILTVGFQVIWLSAKMSLVIPTFIILVIPASIRQGFLWESWSMLWFFVKMPVSCSRQQPAQCRAGCEYKKWWTYNARLQCKHVALQFHWSWITVFSLKHFKLKTL